MRALVVFTLVLPTLVLPAPALADCAAIELALAGVAGDVLCVASPDLTTRNADTTPPDNSRPGLPPNAFTPRTDAQAVSPDAPFRTPIDPDRTFPGLQVTGAMTDDANARWVLRLPTDWNGRLVVGVPGGLRPPAGARLAVGHLERGPRRAADAVGVSHTLRRRCGLGGRLLVAGRAEHPHRPAGRASELGALRRLGIQPAERSVPGDARRRLPTRHLRQAADARQHVQPRCRLPLGDPRQQLLGRHHVRLRPRAGSPLFHEPARSARRE